MRALTVGEPWATAIALGLVTIENDRRPPPLQMLRPLLRGERFAIHAGELSRLHDDDLYWAMQRRGLDWDVLRSKVRPGHLLCTAQLADVVTDPARLTPEQLRWWSGPYAWLLTDVRPLPQPVPCARVWAGDGLWEVPSESEAQVGAWP